MFTLFFLLLVQLTLRHTTAQAKCFHDEGKEKFLKIITGYVYAMTLPNAGVCLIFDSRVFTYTKDEAKQMCYNIDGGDLLHLDDFDELRTLWPTPPTIPDRMKNGAWHVANLPGQCRVLQNFQYTIFQCMRQAGFACQYHYEYNCRWKIALDDQYHGAGYLDQVTYKLEYMQHSDFDHTKNCMPGFKEKEPCNNPQYDAWSIWSSCSETCTTPYGDPPLMTRNIMVTCGGQQMQKMSTATCNTHILCGAPVATTSSTKTTTTSTTTSTTTTTTTPTPSSSTTTTPTTTSTTRTKSTSAVPAPWASWTTAKKETTPTRIITGSVESTGIAGSTRSTSAGSKTKRASPSGTTGGISVIHVVIIAVSLLLLIALLACCLICWMLSRRRKKKKAVKKTTKSSSTSSRSAGSHAGAATKPGQSKTAAVLASLSAVPGQRLNAASKSKSRDTASKDWPMPSATKQRSKPSVSTSRETVARALSKPGATVQRKKTAASKSTSRDTKSPTLSKPGAPGQRKKPSVANSPSRAKVSKLKTIRDSVSKTGAKGRRK